MFKLKNLKHLIYVLTISFGIFTSLQSAQALAVPVHTPSPTYNIQVGALYDDSNKPDIKQCKVDKNAELNAGNCKIIAYLRDFINVLSGLVGIVIVIMIAVGGIQYSSARDNPQQAVAAKNRVINAVLALVFYLFAFAFLQWIVPGGIF